jgi:uncharacterized protein YbjT (DUF2867 family)
MKAILFGATGMIGQGVLRECMLDPEVEAVLAVGRRATGKQHAKLREIVHADFTDFTAIEDELSGFDACFYCLGLSSAGMRESDYQRVTYDFTLAVACVLARRNPGMAFLYVSGAGTDSTERGRTRWARVKGRTENALLQLPFKAAYMLRPAYIQPLHGITSRTPLYRALYAVLGPLFPVWKRLFPQYVITTEQLGRAMIEIAKRGVGKRVLESRDIVRIRSGGSGFDSG